MEAGGATSRHPSDSESIQQGHAESRLQSFIGGSPALIEVHGQVVAPLEELLPTFTPPVTVPVVSFQMPFSRSVASEFRLRP